MIVVYETSTSVEAHLALHQLQLAGISGEVSGENLEGGSGHLLGSGVVKVLVKESDSDNARAIINRWEAERPNPDIRRSTLPTKGLLIFFLGALIGAAGMYAYFYSPVTVDGIDYDGDDRLDEKWIYENDIISEYRLDRNSDGEWDLKYIYDRRGFVTESMSDENFDGKFETTIAYRNGSPTKQHSDFDGDGFSEYRADYENGQWSLARIFDPSTRRLRKEIDYTLGGKRTMSRYDQDGDGRFDVFYEYDEFEEIKSQSNQAMQQTP